MKEEEIRPKEHGNNVKKVMSPYTTYSVNTIEDLRKVEQLMANNKILQERKLRYGNRASS